MLNNKIKIKNMKNFSLFVGILVVTGMLVSAVTFAADTGVVTATVTVQNISVAVTDGLVQYGILPASDTTSTIATDLDDSQTADNDGNITEDFNIIGTDSAAWTLEAAVGSDDEYAHTFCTTTCDATPVWVEIQEASYTSMSIGVASTSNQVFDLKIETPSVSTAFDEQSVDVTIQATAN